MTTKECLHRFCAECIITALRSGNKECPTCRKKLVSKRSLRPDPNFDQLVAKLFPDKEECEEEQEKAGFAHAKRLCRRRSLPANSSEEPRDLDEEDSVKAQCTTIQLRLFPHRNLDEDLLSRLDGKKERFVETSGRATIKHLLQYVKTRLEIELGSLNQSKNISMKDNVKKEEVTKIQIFLGHETNKDRDNRKEDVKIDDLEMTLNAIGIEMWKKNPPVDLSFSFELVSS